MFRQKATLATIALCLLACGALTATTDAPWLAALGTVAWMLAGTLLALWRSAPDQIGMLLADTPKSTFDNDFAVAGLVDRLIDVSRVARYRGNAGLDALCTQYGDDTDLTVAVTLLADGHGAAGLDDALVSHDHVTHVRALERGRVWEVAAAAAPSMAAISAVLMVLVTPAWQGFAPRVWIPALVSIAFGMATSQLVFLPRWRAVHRAADTNRQRRALIRHAVVDIAAGVHPRLFEHKLWARAGGKPAHDVEEDFLNASSTAWA